MDGIRIINSVAKCTWLVLIHYYNQSAYLWLVMCYHMQIQKWVEPMNC